MDKLETLIECLPNAPYKTLFAIEINALRAEIVTLQSDNTRLTLELDEAGSNCSMYKQQVLMLTKERDELEISNAFAHGEWRAVKDQLAAMTKEKNDWYRYHGHVTDELVISQAQEAKLREALAGLREHSLCPDTMVRLLDTPTDDSALMERLKEERENCADAMWQAYLDGEESYSKLHDVIKSMT